MTEAPKADVLVLGARAEVARDAAPAVPPKDAEPATLETLPLWAQPAESVAEQAQPPAAPPAPVAPVEALPEVWLPTLLRRARVGGEAVDGSRLAAVAERLERLRARYRGDGGGAAR